jgi:hypothetical protein
MKFELPVIKKMVVADSPACFDINEAKSFEDVFHNDIWGCPGFQCTCPGCVCPCPCPCQDQLPSSEIEYFLGNQLKILMPKYQRTPPIILMHPIYGLVSHTSPSSNESCLMKNDRYMLRREQFGSVLFNKDTLDRYLCNHTATEILKFVEDNQDIHLNDIERISRHIQETFEDVPEDINSVVYPFLYGCMQLSEAPLVKVD